MCLGFLLTRALTRWFGALAARALRQPSATPRTLHLAQIAAAALVMLLPLVLLGVGLTHSRGYLVAAPHQYQELLNYMARTVLELRLKLPPDMASHLPDGPSSQARSKRLTERTFTSSNCSALHPATGSP